MKILWYVCWTVKALVLIPCNDVYPGDIYHIPHEYNYTRGCIKLKKDDYFEVFESSAAALDFANAAKAYDEIYDISVFSSTETFRSIEEVNLHRIKIVPGKEK